MFADTASPDLYAHTLETCALMLDRYEQTTMTKTTEADPSASGSSQDMEQLREYRARLDVRWVRMDVDILKIASERFRYITEGEI